MFTSKQGTKASWLAMIHGVTRMLCEKGRPVTKSWSAVEHRELIAGGANWKAVGWWTQIAWWSPQFFTEPDQPRSSQIFQLGETVIYSCRDTPEDAFKFVAWLLQGMLCCCDLVYGFTVSFTSQLSPHQNVRSDSNWHLSILHFHCTLIFIWLTPGSSFYLWHSYYREGIWAE